MQIAHEKVNAVSVPAYRKGEFFTMLSAAALKDLESLLIPVSCPAHKVLFNETQPSSGIYVIMQGEVKLSINSRDGRRLSFRIAKAGEVLGLSATLSGGEHEMTAETLYPAKVAHVSQAAFLQFIARHPEVYQVVARDMIRNFNDACEQLRTVCLSSSVPERLARLLLVWSDSGAKTGSGVRCRLSLTHEEIGEFIGASRETVTRTFSKLKHRRLVAQHGATLMIPSRTALEAYARN